MSLSRKPSSYILFILVLALAVALLMQGCEGARRNPSSNKTKSKNMAQSFTEASKITPTRETAQFYDAIKGAKRVIISESDQGLDKADREAVPLSYFTKNQPMFYDVLKAVTSATKQGEP